MKASVMLHRFGREPVLMELTHTSWSAMTELIEAARTDYEDIFRAEIKIEWHRGMGRIDPTG